MAGGTDGFRRRGQSAAAEEDGGLPSAAGLPDGDDGGEDAPVEAGGADEAVDDGGEDGGEDGLVDSDGDPVPVAVAEGLGAADDGFAGAVADGLRLG